MINELPVSDSDSLFLIVLISFQSKPTQCSKLFVANLFSRTILYQTMQCYVIVLIKVRLSHSNLDVNVVMY